MYLVEPSLLGCAFQGVEPSLLCCAFQGVEPSLLGCEFQGVEPSLLGCGPSVGVGDSERCLETIAEYRHRVLVGADIHFRAVDALIAVKV